MADILIKGMELPKDKLEYLHLIIQDGKVHTAISCGHLTTDKLNVATAIELPLHGRLVSEAHLASLIIADIQRLDTTDEYTDGEKELVRKVYKSCLYKLAITPTIVEASNG